MEIETGKRRGFTKYPEEYHKKGTELTAEKMEEKQRECHIMETKGKFTKRRHEWSAMPEEKSGTITTKCGDREWMPFLQRPKERRKYKDIQAVRKIKFLQIPG